MLRTNCIVGKSKFEDICIGYISNASYNYHSKKVLLTADSRNPWVRGILANTFRKCLISDSSTPNPDLDKGNKLG